MTLIATITPIESENEITNNKILRNYARKCVHHGLLKDEFYQKGHSPFHGDLMYHQMFNTNSVTEKIIYENLGLAWKQNAKEVHVYIDYGLNQEMLDRINILKGLGIPVKYCSVDDKNPLIKDILNAINENNSLLYDTSLIKSIDNLESRILRGNLLTNSYNPEYIYEAKTIRFEEKKLQEEFKDFKNFKTVILESPFAGDVKNNVEYAKKLIHDLAYQGFAPSASHLLYTQMLDDTKEFDRRLGIDKGLDYAHNRDSIIGIDRGISNGMKYGYQRAINENRSVTFFTLSPDLNVQNEVRSLRDLFDAKEYVESKKSENSNLFNKTGYIVETELSNRMLKSASKLKRN